MITFNHMWHNYLVIKLPILKKEVRNMDKDHFFATENRHCLSDSSSCSNRYMQFRKVICPPPPHTTLIPKFVGHLPADQRLEFALLDMTGGC